MLLGNDIDIYNVCYKYTMYSEICSHTARTLQSFLQHLVSQALRLLSRTLHALADLCVLLTNSSAHLIILSTQLIISSG